MAKVYLDAGHGGTDSGAVGNGLLEKNLNLSIAKYARTYLLNNYTGVSVRMSRTTDVARSLTWRTNDANKWGADVFVSIHINAFNGKAKGYEDFIYNGPVSSNSPKLQNAIHAETSKIFPTNRGKKRANFAVLRQSRMPAVLTESGFIDNKGDAAILKSATNLRKIGEAHARGIANHLGLKKKAAKKSTSTTSVKIRTGGLAPKMLAETIAYCKARKWYWTAEAKGGANPRLTTGGLDPASRAAFEKWLKARNWFYSVVK
jgi:N-acetylmuramoyl-L-alanine amidase